MNKHVHCEVIKAFADGEKIQFWESIREIWEDIEYPSFLSHYKYRVKPKEVLLEGQPLEVGQKVYYKGSNPLSHVSRLVKDFNSHSIWTTSLTGEELGFNYLEYFTREEPLVEKSTSNSSHVSVIGYCKTYWIVHPGKEEGVYSIIFENVIPSWAKYVASRKMVFKTREGALARFKELFE